MGGDSLLQSSHTSRDPVDIDFEHVRGSCRKKWGPAPSSGFFPVNLPNSGGERGWNKSLRGHVPPSLNDMSLEVYLCWWRENAVSGSESVVYIFLEDLFPFNMLESPTCCLWSYTFLRFVDLKWNWITAFPLRGLVIWRPEAESLRAVVIKGVCNLVVQEKSLPGWSWAETAYFCSFVRFPLSR